MPFTLEGAENVAVRFAKNLGNEVLYRPQEIIYDSAYGTIVYAVLDMTPVPDTIESVVSNLPLPLERRDQISAGITYALINRARAAWMKS